MAYIKKGITKKKRGRKKKTQLQLEHETEHTKLLQKLEGIDLYSSIGLATNDMLRIGIALDIPLDTLRDMFDTFGADIFRAMRID